MSNSDQNKPLSYRDSGVDIDAGNALIERIKPLAKATQRPESLAGLGGFGALFELPTERYRQPVLVSGTDGVGTKLRLALDLNKVDTVGIDLVAMCVNDVIVQGAEPLFFLDYFATGKLQLDQASQVIGGIAAGCTQAGAALIGGETAEMPGMYANDDFDLAGFCVGVVEKDAIIDGSTIDDGQVLIGLASSGPHSNGYSLIRKIVEVTQADLSQPFNEHSLGEVLLEPTRVYVKSLLALMDSIKVHGLAHITGGGLTENIPRMLPKGRSARIHLDSWQWPAIFDWLQTQGNIIPEEMYKTFNCGIGMVVCVDPNDVETALSVLQTHGETAWKIGEIAAADEASRGVELI